MKDLKMRKDWLDKLTEVEPSWGEVIELITKLNAWCAVPAEHVQTTKEVGSTDLVVLAEGRDPFPAFRVQPGIGVVVCVNYQDIEPMDKYQFYNYVRRKSNVFFGEGWIHKVKEILNG